VPRGLNECRLLCLCCGAVSVRRERNEQHSMSVVQLAADPAVCHRSRCPYDAPWSHRTLSALCLHNLRCRRAHSLWHSCGLCCFLCFVMQAASIALKITLWFSVCLCVCLTHLSSPDTRTNLPRGSTQRSQCMFRPDDTGADGLVLVHRGGTALKMVESIKLAFDTEVRPTLYLKGIPVSPDSKGTLSRTFKPFFLLFHHSFCSLCIHCQFSLSEDSLSLTLSTIFRLRHVNHPAHLMISLVFARLVVPPVL